MPRNRLDPFFLGVAVLFWGSIGIVLVLVGRTLQPKLLSKIAADTPISGFYGPGSWWAFLITLGMSHGRVLRSLWTTGELPRGWDYDLVGASCYLVAATIDLILKSHAISRLGEAASESALVPALVCAEFVVWLGSGFSFITVFTAVVVGVSPGGSSGLRMAGIAMIPLTFAFVASGFTRRAHRAIAQTAPVFWCLSHGVILPPEVENVLDAIHFPANFTTFWTIFMYQEYWFWAGVITAATTAVWFLASLCGRQTLRHAAWSATKAGFYTAAISSGILSIPSLLYTIVFALLWFGTWLAVWWPVYVLAFCPQLEYFPPTKISVLEMDQMAALLAVAAVAVIRLSRLAFNVVHSDAEGDPPQELESFLPGPGGSEVELNV
ncbi:hypothetical protein DFH09DRAFT_262544 [Mycena vulgaris]|nr:hypothetical protein DFH09DRAFT_379276 [Mycena vulgaris]KAJ6511861.1 hypothetical protein DFH09DRAFT_262544 [Mycena vulgaris]